MSSKVNSPRFAISLLSSDSRISDAQKALAQGISWIHYDVMDGRFTPREGISLSEIDVLLATLPSHVSELHLMVQNPEPYLVYFLPRVNYLAVHVEACDFLVLAKLVDKYESTKKLGLAINPDSPWAKYLDLIAKVAYVIIMSVVPGAGGQPFMLPVLPKIKALREKFPHLLIIVDGGINDQTAKLAFSSGASLVVVGNYLIKNLDDKLAVKKLLTLGETEYCKLR